jgi:pyruvate/2-oxoacid:ferredoxin oxidoreductase beta subunit
LTPCPAGWRTPSDMAPELAILAVETNIFPLYEIENGKKYTVNRQPRRLPVEEYLSKQGRFKHLNEAQIRSIQMEANEEWDRLRQNAEFGSR